MTEREIIEKINNGELLQYQVYILKDNGAIVLTDNIKWALVKRYPDICRIFDLSDEMIKYVLFQGYFNQANLIPHSFFQKLSEDDIIKIFSAPYIFTTYSMFEILPYFNYTKRIVEKIAERFSRFLLVDEIKPYVDEEIKWIAVKAYCNGEANDYDSELLFPGELGDLTDDMWQTICDNNRYSDILEYLRGGYSVPDFVVEKVVCSDNGYYAAEDIKMSEKVLNIFFDKWHADNNAKKSFKKILSNNKNRLEVIKTYPELYRYIGHPKKAETELAVDLLPENLEFVKKQSEELCLKVLEKDKNAFQFVKDPTDKIIEFMGIENKKLRYPAPFYLVKANENLADEGFLEYVDVIEGKNMETFMDSEFRLNFGNLDDDKIRETYKCFSYQPITVDEYELLKKLKLLPIKSGYWNFDEEESYEDEMNN